MIKTLSKNKLTDNVHYLHLQDPGLMRNSNMSAMLDDKSAKPNNVHYVLLPSISKVQWMYVKSFFELLQDPSF